MEPTEFRPGMDLKAKAMLGASAFLPFFLLAYSLLSSDWLLLSISLFLATAMTTLITWPFLNATYVLTNDEIRITYYRPVSIPIAEIEGAELLDGSHKLAITGFGYYCVNFKDRVLIRAKQNNRKKEYVISPPHADAFVKIINGNKSISSRMKAEEKREEKKQGVEAPRQEPARPAEPAPLQPTRVVTEETAVKGLPITMLKK